MTNRRWVICFLTTCFIPCVYAESQPETATGQYHSAQAIGQSFMAVTANPHASRLAHDILAQGGHAVDAMIAAQFMLNLVEPQSSGIGGGSFVVYWDKKNQHLTTFDGRETAPLAVKPTLFQDNKGQPLKFIDAVVGGRSVGTPGTLKLLWLMHQRYGKLPWKTLIEPTITLAKSGFKVSPRLAELIKRSQPQLTQHPATQSYFFDTKGQPLKAGSLLKNVQFAQALQLISQQGERAFYNGALAQAIVETVHNNKNLGVLSLRDLSIYRVKERIPICVNYRTYKVCSMPPPSSGAITLGQILGILNHFDLTRMGANNPESWRFIADATQLAFVDRDLYLADTDFVSAPITGMLSNNYLSARAAILKNTPRLQKPEPGTPPWQHAYRQHAPDESIELPSTTHMSFVDKDGNVISATSSIENGFGSTLMVGGFLLNNQLTDFSFRTHNNGRLIANAVAPGKRPRSSMTPTIVFNSKNQPILAIGSPGGSRIIPYVATTLIRLLDWDMSLESALNSPHLINRYGPYELEPELAQTPLAMQLEKQGYVLEFKELNSGIHAIAIDDGKLSGSADHRREGIALGQ